MSLLFQIMPSVSNGLLTTLFCYFPGGPYSAFAGRDATRGLATGQVAASDKEYDDVSDLTPDEVASAKEWEDQFKGM